MAAKKIVDSKFTKTQLLEHISTATGLSKKAVSAWSTFDPSPVQAREKLEGGSSSLFFILFPGIAKE